MLVMKAAAESPISMTFRESSHKITFDKGVAEGGGGYVTIRGGEERGKIEEDNL